MALPNLQTAVAPPLDCIVDLFPCQNTGEGRVAWLGNRFFVCEFHPNLSTSKELFAKLKILIVPAGDGSDMAWDLVRKTADVLVAKIYLDVPTEISGLVGRNYFERENICFYVLQFYPEGSSFFVGFDATLLSMGKGVVRRFGRLAAW
ncbi:uncharacterized protein LOC124700739 [Lolium rigidum]|uniref:uncharacterized protein LOC124700739 n=1 Tax=Lolium rigidum TaxID=89674 RepID=UPI001F5C8198|nr:uncharacterized protein LOC124700739 [Lolium rigidum]